MSEWDGIDGFDAWNKKLRDLLDESANAAKDSDPAARYAMSARLTEYIENSFPNDEKIRALDNIASQAAIGLLEQNIDDRLKSVVARNAELAQLTKQFGEGTDEVNSSAAAVRLDRVKKALDVLNQSAASMKDLRGTLQTGSDTELMASIDKALAASEAVRTLLLAKS